MNAAHVRVFKYRLPIQDFVRLDLPEGAEFVLLAEQHGQLCVWYRVDTLQPPAQRVLRIAGTGHPCAVGEHLGSVLLHGGDLVLHVFDATAILADREAS